MRVGVDTGGTFTDVVAEDGRIAKVLSTPDDPARAVRAGVEAFAPDVLAHGTTVPPTLSSSGEGRWWRWSPTPGSPT